MAAPDLQKWYRILQTGRNFDGNISNHPIIIVDASGVAPLGRKAPRYNDDTSLKKYAMYMQHAMQLFVKFGGKFYQHR